MAEKPSLLDSVRHCLRLKHYSIRTELVYVQSIRRFILLDDLFLAVRLSPPAPSNQLFQSSCQCKLLLTFYTKRRIYNLQTVYRRVGVGEKKTDLLQGTLDLLVLKALALSPLHGLGVSHRIEQITRGTFQVKPGSLFPALHRMEEAGWLQSSWGESENNRRAKYYRLTRAGQRQLEAEIESWQRISLAITSALKAI
jgi:PadR family transcriptional regulator PadR